MSNRAGITVRFNLEEQQDLRALAKFWKKSEKDIIKFAFWQLADSTRKLTVKLQEEAKEQENVSSETTSPTGSSPSSSSSSESTESQAPAAT